VIAFLSGYRREWLRLDIVAGLSVAAVALPVAIAYSQLAGVSPVHGLYASLLPLVAYALLGSSRQLILAPDSATCAIVASVVVPLAGQDPARYLALTAALAITGGLICIAAGFLRLGVLTNFLAKPILAGYLNGIAIWIFTSQLGTLFGFKLPSEGFFRLSWHFVSKLNETHGLTLVVGVTTLALLVLFARFAPKMPAALIAVVASIACSAAFALDQHGVKLLGMIPAGLPVLTIPAIAWRDWEALLPGAAGLALISYTSGMVTCRGFASKNHYDVDSNREFIAMGVADIGAGLLQGFAISGADSRTAMNDSAGGKTQVAGLVTAAVLALTLMFFTAPLAWLPMAVLSAILMKAALGLFDLKGLRELRLVSPKEFWLCLITLLGTITVGVLPGVLVAVGVAVVLLLITVSRPHDAVLGRVPGTNAFLNAATHPGLQTYPALVIYRFDASLVFFNADHFRARVKTVIREATAPVKYFLLDTETMPLLDTTGAAALEQLRGELETTGINMAIAGPKHLVSSMLGKTGLADKIGRGMLFPNVESAIDSLMQVTLGQAAAHGAEIMRR